MAGRGPSGYNKDFPFGQVPTLEIDGRLFTQSVELSKWAAAGTVLYVDALAPAGCNQLSSPLFRAVT